MTFERAALRQLTLNITDGEHASVTDDPNGDYFLLSNKNIINGIVKYDNSDRKISKETFEKISKRTKLNKNDVLLSTVGTIGKVAIIRDDKIQFDFQRSVGIIKCDLNKLRPEYLYYYFKQNFVQKRLDNVSKGAVQKCLFINDIENFLIDYPIDITHQLKITQILSALDSKIELNNRINTELEVMAKSIYDYWFVQFDFPNANGKPFKSSGGKMVWNGTLKREIPEGWEVESIENSCLIIDCLHSKKSDLIYEDPDSFLLQLDNIKDDGLLDMTNKYYVAKLEYERWTTRIEVKEDDILITNAGRVAATAQMPKGIKSGIGRNITAIRPFSIKPTYLFLSIRSADIKRQIILNTDSGAFFKSFNVKGIKKLQLLRPIDTIEEMFESIVRPIRQKKELNNFENQKLTELRDWLLPMLMNGQVKVN